MKKKMYIGLMAGAVGLAVVAHRRGGWHGRAYHHRPWARHHVWHGRPYGVGYSLYPYQWRTDRLAISLGLVGLAQEARWDEIDRRLEMRIRRLEDRIARLERYSTSSRELDDLRDELESLREYLEQSRAYRR